jgi:hypothetical protein
MRSGQVHRRIDDGEIGEDDLRALAVNANDAAVRVHAAAALGDDEALFAAVAGIEDVERVLWSPMREIKNPAVLLRIRGAVGDSSLRSLLIWQVAAVVDLDEAEALLIGDLDDDGRSELLRRAPGVFGPKPDWDAERWDALCARLALDDPSAKVRASAARSIGELSVRGRVLSTSADDAVRLAAVTEGLDAGLLLRVAAHDPSRDVRRAALMVLAEGLDEVDGIESLALDDDAELALDAARAVKRRTTVEHLRNQDAPEAIARELATRPGWRVLVSFSKTAEAWHVYLLPPHMVSLGRLWHDEMTGGSNFFTPEGTRRRYLRGEGEESDLMAALDLGGANPILTAPFRTFDGEAYSVVVFPMDDVDLQHADPRVVVHTRDHIVLAVVGIPVDWKDDDRRVRGRTDVPDTRADEWDGSVSYPAGGFRRLIARRLALRVFACYAREDIGVVRMVQSLHKALPLSRLDYDIEILTAGDDWEHSLDRAIRDADLFQLFWSPAAADSEQVEREWRFALSRDRKGFICPVYWGSDAPDPAPPAELRHLHFQRLGIDQASP